MSQMDSRFYEKEFPQAEDLVMVQVTRIEEHGAYVSLLEYDGMEGLILVSELSKRRIRSISKLVRVGQVQTCAVLRVEKGNVDLSKKKVRSDEARLFESKFANAKAVHSIMRHIATHHNISAEEVCRAVSWPVSFSFVFS
jgi:translation initiation factor 2 subunit 1